MTTKRTINLEFSPEFDNLSEGKELRDGLSVALQIGDTLWVTNDETVSLERLSLIKHNSNFSYGQHKHFLLADYLELPVTAPKDPADIEEVDIEGLAYSEDYLWLVGSHSLKRSNPTVDDGLKQAKSNWLN